MGNNPKFRTKAPASAIDEDLLASYAKEFGPVLLRNFMRRGAQRSTAEDLSQSVFVRLAQRESGNSIDNPRAYLMQTASSVWNDHLAMRYRRSHQDHVEYEEIAHSPETVSSERVLEGRELLERIIEVLNELPEKTRQIYALCRIEGLKRREVAERFNMSASGVDKHLIIATAHIGAALGKLT
ncbi:RNA polymerase sigma factor [Porticoccus sp. GXU_MW_L64]